MTRGSKFGRERESRAARTLTILRSINRLRRVVARADGGSAINEANARILRQQETRLRERDEVFGYDKTWWLVHGNARDFRPMQHGETLHSACQCEYRK